VKPGASSRTKRTRPVNEEGTRGSSRA
jgi:hypothetical protein